MDSRIRTIAGLLALTWAGVAWGAELQVKDYNGTPFVTGGVGATEQEAIREATADYNLGLTFAGKDGRYLAGVEVTVKNRAGDVVLSAVSDGPMMLADLPAGRYTVEATFEGETHTRELTLAEDRHHQVVMSWSLPAPSDTPARSGTRDTS